MFRKRSKSQHSHAVSAIAFAIVISSSSANADVFTDLASFNGANQGLNFIDFEGVAPDGGVVNASAFYAELGVLFPGNARFPTEVRSGNGSVFTAPSDYLMPRSSRPLVMTFSDSVSSVGFNVTAMDTNTNLAALAEVTVYSGNTIIATETFNTSSITDFTTFIGFSNLGQNISRVQVRGFGVVPFSGIDNLSFGVSVVPLPPAAFAGLAMFGFMGAYRRIQK